MKKEKLKSLQFNKAMIAKMTTTNLSEINAGEEGGIRRTILGYKCQHD